MKSAPNVGIEVIARKAHHREQDVKRIRAKARKMQALFYRQDLSAIDIVNEMNALAAQIECICNKVLGE